MPTVGFSWQKKTLLKDPFRVLLGRVPVGCVMAGKRFESPRLEESLSQMGESVRGRRRWRERMESVKKAQALQKAIPNPFVGLPFSLSLSFEGICYSAPSLCLCPHFFFHSFLKILFCDVSFCALLSFSRWGPFFVITPSSLSQICLPPHPPHIQHKYVSIFNMFQSASHSHPCIQSLTPRQAEAYPPTPSPDSILSFLHPNPFGKKHFHSPSSSASSPLFPPGLVRSVALTWLVWCFRNNV